MTTSAPARAAKLDNIRLLYAGLGEGKLERAQFDRVLLVTVLGEIPDRDAAMAIAAGGAR